MNTLYKKALKAYIQMLEIHIDTKTKNLSFHKETGEFYEKLFEMAHSIWEKYVDLGGKIEETTLEEKKSQAQKIVKEFRENVEKYAKTENLTLGTEDLLAPMANTLEDMEGTLKSLVK